MKILQINCVYNKGSTGKITADIHHHLLNYGMESVVCYGRGEKCQEPGVYKTCGEGYSHVQHLIANITGIMYGGCWLSTNRLISIIKKEKPDIVHLQCINGYFVNIYRIISWLKKNHVKTVLTLHAEFMHTANCGHALDCDRWKTGCGNCPRLKKETNSYFLDGTSRSWEKMKQSFEGFNDGLIVASVSPWLMERAKQSPILADKRHTVVLNGLDTNIFSYQPANDIRTKYARTGENVVFFATPYFSLNPDHIKGGYYLNELAKRMPKVKFVVAGSYEEGIKVSENISLLGRISDQKVLARLYSMADVTVLTSMKETFSMITAETLCCGTPIIGFRAGAPELITIPEYSEFVESRNLDNLQSAVNTMISRQLDHKLISDHAKKKYSSTTMTEEYMNLYNSL